MDRKFDILVIGAGIVGLATAYKLLLRKPNLKVGVIEKENAVAVHQSGNNSGVIHSGIYYKPGSLKALNCRNGYRQLLDFSQQHQIHHEICGKVIVATKKEELPMLESILQRGNENGLVGLRMLGERELLEKEPHVNGIRAIWVPQAGIINYRDVSLKLAELIQKSQGELLFNQQVSGILNRDKTVVVQTEANEFSCNLLLNCAGLYADKIGRLTEPERNIRVIPFRGEYFVLKKEREQLVNNLIYPVPDPAFPFLGVHFTRMIKGGIEAGPNAVLAFSREGYSRSKVHPAELAEILAFPGFRKLASRHWKTGLGELYRSYSKQAFVKALRNLLPEINSQDLTTGGAGVRAMACDHQGNLIDDYFISGKGRVINVWNAPSPAATSSLSIGDTLAEKALNRLYHH